MKNCKSLIIALLLSILTLPSSGQSRRYDDYGRSSRSGSAIKGVEWGVLALIIVFQPEIRRILEQLGSKNIRLLRTLAPEKELPELERAIDQTVLACTEMSQSRTGA